jgi:hypothetical protein
MNFRWRATAAVPAAVLLLVACIQLTLTRTSGLSPWKGGGFGMFSTTDDAGRRSVRVFVTAPDRSEELTITPSLEDAAHRAAVLPDDWHLTRLARRVLEREQRHGRPVEVVRVECWRIDYAAATLEATPRMARAFVYRVNR